MGPRAVSLTARGEDLFATTLFPGAGWSPALANRCHLLSLLPSLLRYTVPSSL